jgi:hypothetical protein
VLPKLDSTHSTLAFSPAQQNTHLAMLAAVKLLCSFLPVHGLVVETFLLGLVLTPLLPISGKT